MRAVSSVPRLCGYTVHYRHIWRAMRSGVSGASGVFDDRAEKRCRFEASSGRVTRHLPSTLPYRYHACFYVFLFSGSCNKRAKLSKVAEMLAFFDLKKV